MKLLGPFFYFALVALWSDLAIQQAASFSAPLEVQYYKFWDSSTGESVNIKGIDYYPRPNTGQYDINNVDFFNEDFRHVWEADITHLKSLGVNAIRLYAVDPGKNHTGFMCALAEAGIYAIVGLSASCSNCSVTPDTAPYCYPPALKLRGQLIIGAFSQYSNVLGFDAGNEVDLTTNLQPWINAPCQKKFLRDMRAYMAGCPVRQIPVGLSIADIQTVVQMNYYNCYTTVNQDPYELANWVGINAYQSCDASVTNLSDAPGYQMMIQDYSNYSIPLLLTEYGCLNPSFPTIDGFQAQRTFYASRWMFEPGMHDTLAGGFVFEYSVEVPNAIVPYPFTNYSAGNYGIGYFSPANCDNVNITCSYNPKPEFYNLQKEYAATKTRGTYNLSTFSPPDNRLQRSPCPSGWMGLDDFTWAADSVANLYCPGVSSFTCPGAPSYSFTTSPSAAISFRSPSDGSSRNGSATEFPTVSTIPLGFNASAGGNKSAFELGAPPSSSTTLRYSATTYPTPYPFTAPPIHVLSTANVTVTSGSPHTTRRYTVTVWQNRLSVAMTLAAAVAVYCM